MYTEHILKKGGCKPENYKEVRYVLYNLIYVGHAMYVNRSGRNDSKIHQSLTIPIISFNVNFKKLNKIVISFPNKFPKVVNYQQLSFMNFEQKFKMN